jgi:hypothetical protein
MIHAAGQYRGAIAEEAGAVGCGAHGKGYTDRCGDLETQILREVREWQDKQRKQEKKPKK